MPGWAVAGGRGDAGGVWAHCLCRPSFSALGTAVSGTGQHPGQEANPAERGSQEAFPSALRLKRGTMNHPAPEIDSFYLKY